MDPTDFKLASLKTQIALARQRLNRVWEVNQMTDTEVLAVGAELDKLCNEYERLLKNQKLVSG